jgi:hypothetical protein
MFGFSMKPTCATTSHDALAYRSHGQSRFDVSDSRLLAGHHRQQHHPLVHHAIELDVVEQARAECRMPSRP